MVVAWAATLCDRPAITRSGARRQLASRDSVATALSRTSSKRANLQLFDILGEVADCHSLVDVLVPCQCRELLDPRLHVVAGTPRVLRSTRGPRCRRRPGTSMTAVEDVEPEVTLRLQHSEPQLPLEDDFVLG